MLIVLDTNCFFGDVHARKAWLSAVIDGAEHGDFELATPETVIQELVKQYPERLREAIEDANTAVGRVSRELRRLDVPGPSRVEVDQASLVAGYEAALRTRLTGTGLRIAPLPTDLSAAVEWAIQRRKPFKPEGDGMPDAAIWLTTLTLAEHAEEVVLVSTNTEDFGDGQSQAQLAPELVADLRAKGLPSDRVRLVTSIKTLVDQVVQPLAAADARASRMLTDPRLTGRLSAALSDALLYSPIPQEGLRLGVDLDEDPQPIMIDFESFDLVSAREIADEELLLELRVEADMLLDMTIFKADAYIMDEDSPVSISDPDFNDHYAEGEAEISAWLTVHLTTDLEALDVTFEELTEAERLSDEEIVARRLERGAGDELLRQLRNPADGATLTVNRYRPPEAVESSVEDAQVNSLDPSVVELESVDDVVAGGIGCSLRVRAEADVQWLVSAPTPYELETFASLAEGNEDGAGWLTDVAASEPLVIRLTAVLTPEGKWRDLDIVEVTLEPNELERRAAQMDPELERLAELVTQEDENLESG